MDFITSRIASNGAPTIFVPTHEKYYRAFEFVLIDNTVTGDQNLTYTQRDTRDNSVVDSGTIAINGKLYNSGIGGRYPIVLLRPWEQLEMQTDVGDMYIIGMVRVVRGAWFRIPSNWSGYIPPTS